MNKHLQQLIQIAQIDTESDAFNPIMLQKREQLDKLIAQKSTYLTSITKYDEEKREKSQAITRSEAQVAENNSKLESIAQRIKDGCSDREARSLAIEEDLAKEQIKHANNEIARLHKEKEACEQKEQDIHQQIVELESAIQAEQKKVDGEIEEIKHAQQAIFLKKEQQMFSMDQNIIAFYEKIRRWAKNSSVVPIKRNACGGCFIKLNDKILADMAHSADIITCPHCGRILYLES